MIALYILLGLLLLLLLPVGIRFRFDGESRLTVRYAGIPVWRYSSEKEKKREERPPNKPRKVATKGKKKPQPEKPSPLKELTGRLREEGAAAVAVYLKELARLLATAARRLIRILRFGRCTVIVAVAAPDAAETALRYGKLCGVVYPAREILEQTLKIRRLDFEMRPDFLRKKDEVWADIRLHILPLPALAVAIRTLFAYMGMTIRLDSKKQRKGVENG